MVNQSPERGFKIIIDCLVQKNLNDKKWETDELSEILNDSIFISYRYRIMQADKIPKSNSLLKSSAKIAGS